MNPPYQHPGPSGHLPVAPVLDASHTSAIPSRDIDLAQMSTSLARASSRLARDGEISRDAADALLPSPEPLDRSRGGRRQSPARRFFEAVTETIPGDPPVVKRKFVCVVCKGAHGTRGAVRSSHSFQVAASVRHLLDHCNPPPENLALLAEAKEVVSEVPKAPAKKAVAVKGGGKKAAAAASSDYGEAYGLWRAEASGPWAGFVRHAFVDKLSNGSLPASAFLRYLRQDYVFLVHFSRAWALAVAKADSLSEMKVCSGIVDALLNKEMRLHIETCAAAGISQKELESTAEAPETISYTRYALEAGYSGDFLDLLAALAPCILGYGEIGARLGREATSDLYADWIATYSGLEYQSLCRDVGALIDSALLRRFGQGYATLPRMKTLSDRFKAGTELEIGFWNMGLR